MSVCCLLALLFSQNTVVPLTHGGHVPRLSVGGCLKLWVVLNPACPVFFSCTYICMKKFNF